MKSIAMSVLLAAFLVGPAVAAGADHKPKHGGLVIKTKSGDFERPQINIHVSDHGKAMKLASGSGSGSGKVTVFNGSESKEAPLTLAGDRLEG